MLLGFRKGDNRFLIVDVSFLVLILLDYHELINFFFHYMYNLNLSGL
jgi:hypothetical protein